VEWQTGLEAVDVPPTLSFTVDVSSVGEIGDDPLAARSVISSRFAISRMRIR